MPPHRWTSSNSFFVPARSSRHRTACLALYRALLEASPKVPLPVDLKTAWGNKRHPIANVIRRAFIKNRNDTSPRLVYPALEAGYRMLDTLSKAANPDTPEYDSILTFLRKRLAERNHVLQQKEAHPPHSKTPRKPSSAPNPSTIPLLVKTTPAPTPENPKPKPTYASEVRPRPSSDLPPGKKRRIPVLDMAREYPFLRLGRPQSPTLDRVLTQKNKARVQMLDRLRDWNDDDSTLIGVADCREEDHWDRLVLDLLDREGQGQQNGFTRRVQHGSSELSFMNTLHTNGITHVLQALTADREDAVARADAMRQIIKEEKAMAALEKAQDHENRRRRWEARMTAEHGAGWEDIIAEQKRQRDEARAALMRLPEKERIAVVRKRRLERRVRLEQEEKERLATVD
ncbi:hypothetical protein PFICI_10652 [Pestalotiopsis fici W106-1]|uniref:Uncharacterized protein n=1 Tax=Pestalotiopsis fici (strain W106-1 / CGMCC3.15140) TaxID=1229662 RepID=W3WXM3_PESFW|nr:uncharacterized protein PFICI_10652 [Pestalotiopsis fici W106-1]ETS78590.1 hypothetical protein PFICI_10652 [Pestalotiopsis fici W106-1]